MSVNISNVGFKTAIPGSCSVNCENNFIIFLAIICLITTTSSAGTTPSLLLTLRCVDARDKAVAMGFYLTVLCLFAFIPSPVIFGYIIGLFIFFFKDLFWELIVLVIYESWVYLFYFYFIYYIFQILPVFSGIEVALKRVIAGCMTVIN